MESKGRTNMESKGYSIDPRDIVRRMASLTEGYGLEEGRRVFEATERVMGFAPWWDREVRCPVMKLFREVRMREQLERHEMELERLRASAPNVSISQPQAQTGIALPYGSGIGQANLLESGASASYGTVSNA